MEWRRRPFFSDIRSPITPSSRDRILLPTPTLSRLRSKMPLLQQTGRSIFIGGGATRARLPPDPCSSMNSWWAVYLTLMKLLYAQSLNRHQFSSHSRDRPCCVCGADAAVAHATIRLCRQRDVLLDSEPRSNSTLHDPRHGTPSTRAAYEPNCQRRHALT